MFRSILIFACCLLGGLSAWAAPPFIAFESGPVRPLALSPDGSRLFAANTPDNRLEIFAITAEGLRHQASVPVGLEPVAVAVRDDNEVWVVNHLSDSVSIVRLDGPQPRVARTLLVGDEPRDIVFAGAGGNRAFITTAHRGQHRTHASLADVPGAGDPQLTTPGIPRADVWVFDADSLGHALGGTPLKIVGLFGDTPRALAVSPDRSTVYAAVFFSGNQTTTVSLGAVCPGIQSEPCVIRGVEYPGGNPGPAANYAGVPAPHVGLIVKHNPLSGHFEDEQGRNWDAGVRFSLPDKDVFAIDAATLNEKASFAHVGTTLFNMAVNPVSGALYVSNTESNNRQRFEGPGNFSGGTVQGHIAESRVTVIDGAAVRPRHLNKHIDYAIHPAPPEIARHSLATPTDMVVSDDGRTLYVAAFGSSKIGVFDTAALENDSFDPTRASADYLTVSGGGPAGLALDGKRQRLYVLTRFDNAVAVVDLAGKTELARVPMLNPEPASLVQGRPFLYDARLTSANGEASCAGCHVFGDMDHLAWDLGNPDGDVIESPLPINLEKSIQGTLFAIFINGMGNARELHPMKGPMTTQTLRGMVNHGAMHWRGDRAVGAFGTDQRRTAPFDSRLSFKNFSVAFDGLLGRATPGTEAEMDQFADFALQLTLPPNPVRNLDNNLTPAQRRGRTFYFGCDSKIPVSCVNGKPVSGQGHISDGNPFIAKQGFNCNGCHTLAPAKGYFGTSGKASFEALPQIAKIPQLRNLYQKVGMFGQPDTPFYNTGDNAHQGEQVRGFGFLHEGSVDTIFRFFNNKVFNPDFGGQAGFFGGNPQRRDVEQFMLAYDSDLPPIVGQQVTLTATRNAEVDKRLALLVRRAESGFASKLLGPGAKECELVARGNLNGQGRGWLYDGNIRKFISDRTGEPRLSLAKLRDLAVQPGQEQTYTCVPWGTGRRMALDRDLDGVLDGDEGL